MQEKDTDFFNFFGQRLRNLREARHLSQKELGKYCDSAGTTVSSWEDGSASPNRSKWEGLAHALGVSQALLMTGTPSSRDDFAILDSLNLKWSGHPESKITSKERTPEDSYRHEGDTYLQYPYSRMINPNPEQDESGDAGSPTRQDCAEAMSRILSRAEREKGGLGWLYVELKKLQKDAPFGKVVDTGETQSK